MTRGCRSLPLRPRGVPGGRRSGRGPGLAAEAQVPVDPGRRRRCGIRRPGGRARRRRQPHRARSGDQDGQRHGRSLVTRRAGPRLGRRRRRAPARPATRSWSSTCQPAGAGDDTARSELQVARWPRSPGTTSSSTPGSRSPCLIWSIRVHARRNSSSAGRPRVEGPEKAPGLAARHAAREPSPAQNTGHGIDEHGQPKALVRRLRAAERRRSASPSSAPDRRSDARRDRG